MQPALGRCEFANSLPGTPRSAFDRIEHHHTLGANQYLNRRVNEFAWGEDAQDRWRWKLVGDKPVVDRLFTDRNVEIVGPAFDADHEVFVPRGNKCLPREAHEVNLAVEACSIGRRRFCK